MLLLAILIRQILFPVDCTICVDPPSTLPNHMWGNADASTFRIRSANYLQDKVKQCSQEGLFKLFATGTSVIVVAS